MRFILIFCFTAFFRFVVAQPDTDNPFSRVNSTYDEQNPVISPDGLTLYFTIGNHPENTGGKKDPGDIWISRFSNGAWSAPVHGGAVLNNRAYNSVAGISADGKQLFLHGHYDASGKPARSQGLAVSQASPAGWGKPKNITIPYYHNRSAILSGVVSDDGTVFVFAAETYGTLGVEDLYVSLYEDGKWTEPRNLGPSVNTTFQELSPSLSPDNRTVYFSSNGRKGSGSFDVYRVRRLDDTWTAWSEPENLGPSVNTSGRELYFRLHPSGAYGLFTSTLNSDGYGDIRMYRPAEPLTVRDTTLAATSPLPVDTVVAIVENLHEQDRAATGVTVYGKVTNARTGEPVTGRVTFIGPSADSLEVVSGDDGYAADVSGDAEYRITIEARGFISAWQTLDIRTYEMQRLEMNFTLLPAEVGTTVNLRHVLFAQSRTDFLPESYPELDLVVRFMKDNPSVRIELSGHTDGRGVAADNLRLSQARVDKVKEYLVSKGVESRRITGKGYGGTRPVAGNDTEESRRLNRRVEFTIRKS